MGRWTVGEGTSSRAYLHKGKGMLKIPFDFQPMEAVSVNDVGRQFEPKWDGFRCLVFKDGDDISLCSKRQNHIRSLLTALQHSPYCKALENSA